MAAATFYLNHLNTLVGARVVKAVVDTEGYCTLIFHFPDGAQKGLTLLSDDEGNGPGSFELHLLKTRAPSQL